MGTSEQRKMTIRIATCLSAVILLTACGGGGGSGVVEPLDQAQSDATVTATGNGNSSSNGNNDIATGAPLDGSNITDSGEFVPTPGNGLDIAFADPDQDVSANTDYIGSQWEYMQTCLEVSALEPTVTVIEGKLTPIDSNDDVIRHIDGQIQVSSHVTDVSASIQVRSEDFDGTLGKPGSYLRSIMGRYLWLANNLEERDYPHECARGE